jgi:hypothetical protein
MEDKNISDIVKSVKEQAEFEDTELFDDDYEESDLRDDIWNDLQDIAMDQAKDRDLDY